MCVWGWNTATGHTQAAGTEHVRGDARQSPPDHAHVHKHTHPQNIQSPAHSHTVRTEVEGALRWMHARTYTPLMGMSWCTPRQPHK